MRRLFAALLILFSGMTFHSLAAAAPAVEPLKPATVTMHVTAEAGDKLNLNTADAASLEQKLKGIGKAKAEAILAYREANGPFTSVDQLLEVKGVGKALLDKNRDLLTVE